MSKKVKATASIYQSETVGVDTTGDGKLRFKFGPFRGRVTPGELRKIVKKVEAAEKKGLLKKAPAAKAKKPSNTVASPEQIEQVKAKQARKKAKATPATV